MKAIHTQIADFFANKRIALLGFGKEGRSTLTLIRSYHRKLPIYILDEHSQKPPAIKFDRYTRFVASAKFKKIRKDEYDLLIISPGIPLSKLSVALQRSQKVFGQAGLFLQWFGWQTIGITGTKGKSTTSSLTYHLLKKSGIKVFLGGNIGVPLFDLIPKLSKSSYVVAELSCHQLNIASASPHIGIFLNLFEEHLDYYKDAQAYFESKLSIFKYQNSGDTIIYNKDDKRITKYLRQHSQDQIKISYSQKNENSDLYINSDNLSTDLLRGNDFVLKSRLLGKINYYNIMPAVAVAAKLKVTTTNIKKHLSTFEPLPHRLQYLGKIKGVSFVNDSISTIPEATEAAINALGDIGCLFLGGKDRGINYGNLITYLIKKKIQNIVFFDKAGKRMFSEYKSQYPKQLTNLNTLLSSDFAEAIQFCLNNTPSDTYCLLSPAASSYGIFKNFEDRGDQFRKWILKLSQRKKFDP